MLRSIFTAIMLILWWVLALYGLIIARAPDLKDEFDKIIPLQWAIGIVLLILGIFDFFNIFNIFLGFKSWLRAPLLQLAALFTKLILWFVLSYGLITKYVLTNMQPPKKKWRKKKWELTWEQKTNKIYKRLTYIQVPFGIIAIILGTLALMLTLYAVII